jgi:hypothetical protein
MIGNWRSSENQESAKFGNQVESRFGNHSKWWFSWLKASGVRKKPSQFMTSILRQFMSFFLIFCVFHSKLLIMQASLDKYIWSSLALVGTSTYLSLLLWPVLSWYILALLVGLLWIELKGRLAWDLDSKGHPGESMIYCLWGTTVAIL